jgi:predicted O-methyltransferase YrrM
MKLATAIIRSLGIACIAGLAGASLNAALASLGLSSGLATIPVAIGLIIIVSIVHYWKTLMMRILQDEFRQVRKHMSLLGNGISETQGLVQLAGLQEPYPMPFGGSWALTPDAATVLAREVAIRRPDVIVELGSGVSTVMVGRLLQQIGSGRLISLDHDPEWAEKTRRHVLASGLQDYVEVIDAPLEKQTIDGQEYDWYRIPEQLRQIERIDMLAVDGPPQSTDSEILSRYPALPVFANQFSDQAVIYVDDAKRVTETEMVRQWLQNYPGWKSWTFETIPGTCILERQH